MSRTTSRGRAAGIGLGALAAVALVATPVAAAPAQEPVEVALDAASPEDFYVNLYGDFGDDDQASILRSIPVPDSGRVEFTVPTPLVATDPDAVSVVLFDSEANEDAESEEDLVPLVLESTVEVEVTEEADGFTTVDILLPVDDPVLVPADGDPVDDVEVAVSGFSLPGLADQDVTGWFSLDLQRSGLADLLVVDPAPVTGFVDVGLELQDIALDAGGSIRLVAPEGSVGEALGLGTFGYVDAYLYPIDDDGWFAWSRTTSFDVLSGDSSPLPAAVAERRPDEVLRSAAVEASATDADDELDEDDLYLDTAIAEDGRSALLTSSADLPGGQYFLQLVAYSEDDENALSASGLVDVTAAPVEPAPEPEPEPSAPAPAPQPTPTVTVIAPAPAQTATATRVPARQNPGLRSNTGVETAAAPGLSDGQLVGLGAGLLLLGSAAGAVALRSQRRARA